MLAIVITIMVLELEVPHEPTFGALLSLWPVLLSYVLSFVYVGLYWNNHHHLFQAADHVSGATLWANLHALFWLSLFPFATAWMGENQFGAAPVAAYGFVLLMAAVGWDLLRRVLLRGHPTGSTLARAVGDRPTKEWGSLAAYAAGIGLAFVSPVVSLLLYGAVAVVWLVPDRRIERAMKQEPPAQASGA